MLLSGGRLAESNNLEWVLGAIDIAQNIADRMGRCLTEIDDFLKKQDMSQRERDAFMGAAGLIEDSRTMLAEVNAYLAGITDAVDRERRS